MWLDPFYNLRSFVFTLGLNVPGHRGPVYQVAVESKIKPTILHSLLRYSNYWKQPRVRRNWEREREREWVTEASLVSATECYKKRWGDPATHPRAISYTASSRVENGSPSPTESPCWNHFSLLESQNTKAQGSTMLQVPELRWVPVCASAYPTGRVSRIPVVIIGAAALRLRIALLKSKGVAVVLMIINISIQRELFSKP